MKKSIFALAFIIFSSVSLFAQNETLRGDEAIKQLQQTGQYDSLINAVKDARKKNGQTVEPQTEDAIGQTVKLTASDGAGNDRFGYSVAISNDTAIVGSAFDNVGANSDQGSAYVFVRNGTVWTQQAQLTATSGTTDDLFGTSVSISGDTVIVGAAFGDIGANLNQGAAYIFVRNSGVWTQQAQLLAADGALQDGFGVSVSIDGDTAIIGANLDDVGANFNQGSAYIFERIGGVWTQQAQLNAADGAAGDSFGISVAISGDTVIAGAYEDTVGGTPQQGSAYVYVRNAGVWTQQAQLTAADGGGSDSFGVSVSISGDTAVIGADFDDVGGNVNQGSAYIFVRNAGVWTQQAQLIAPDGASQDEFGWSVAISGDTAIVGAFQNDVGANGNQGSAYVYVRSGGVWILQQQLTAHDGSINDRFGYNVAISGEYMIVGAYFDSIGANTNQGSAYIQRVLFRGWTQEAQNVASDGAVDDNFGYGVAINGDTAVVGAAFDDVGANTNQGSAYVFVRNGTVWTQQAKLTASDGAANDQFGRTVAIYGDTAIVGAAADDVGVISNQGSAYVFVRNGTTWTEQARLNATIGLVDDLFGISVSIEGNTAIVGAQGDDVGANLNQGSAYVFTRSGETWTQQAQLLASDGAATDLFGTSVGISGNTAIVSAYADDDGANTDQGSVYVFTRSGSVWTEQAKLNAADGAASDFFGFGIAIDGDTAVIGAFGDNVGANADQGSAYIFVRSGVTWTQQAQITATGGAANDQFGYSVSIDGDTAVIGAITDNVGATIQQGSAHVFARNVGVWTQQAQLTATSGAAFDGFGWSVAISGDKIIVSAPFSNASANIPLAPQVNDQGAVFIYINNLAPNAAGVSVSGRILNADGIGVRNAVISATLANGEVRTIRSSSFGYYNFDDLEAGQTIVISVNSKRFSFTPQVVTLSDNIEELNFWAQ